jgi:hypothetical protein
LINVNVQATVRPGNIFSGQQAVTTTAAPLPANILAASITVQARTTNTISIFLGGAAVTTTTGLELPPGAAITLQITNSNVVYVVAASTGANVSWAGN